MIIGYIIILDEESKYNSMLIKAITIFAFAVIFSSNAVYALLNLIIVFLLTFGLLIKSSVEFIAYLYLLVYLGAVIMIFLFVTMLYNFKEIVTLQIGFWDFFNCLLIIGTLEYFILAVLQSEVEELIFDEHVFNNKLLYFLDNPQFCNDMFYFDLVEFSAILFNEEWQSILWIAILLMVIMTSLISIFLNFYEYYSFFYGIHRKYKN